MKDHRPIGILGGTFDPVHCGHLDAAEAARTALGLAEVLLMPSHVAPHRRIQPWASAYHRFAMVALATTDRPGLSASDFELLSPGPSYTSATMDRLAGAGYNPQQLFFIAGADAFAEIATWHDYPAFLERCHFVVVTRPGFRVADLRRELSDLARYMIDVDPGGASSADVHSRKLPSIWLLDTPTNAAASTDIRHRLQTSGSLDDLIPPQVERYIQRHHLYELDPAASELHE